MTYDQPGHVWLLLLLVLSLALYFVPTVVAVGRHSHLLAAVVVVNVLLGWTFVGWVVALVMAVMRPSVVTPPPPPSVPSGPVYSPDGGYIWDGYRWVPVGPPPPPEASAGTSPSPPPPGPTA